jgi:hypothetical protein
MPVALPPTMLSIPKGPPPASALVTEHPSTAAAQADLLAAERVARPRADSVEGLLTRDVTYLLRIGSMRPRTPSRKTN